jgi:hypothetical protein
LEQTQWNSRRLIGARSDEYDSNFAYRFLIRLRNYAAHCGKPVGQLKGSASADRPGGTVAGELRLFLSRDNLLRNFDGCSAVRSEIENLPEPFEIDSYVNELVSCLRRIQRLVCGNRNSRCA